MLIVKEKSQLVIVDVQEKLVSVMPKPHAFIDNIIKLQKAAKILDIPTLYSEQYPKGLGKTIKEIIKNFDKNTEGVIKTEFAVSPGTFEHGVPDHCIICGIEAHVCVLQTAFEFADHGDRVFVVQDAISSRYEKDYLTALSRLDKYPNIDVVSCEMVLFEWLVKSDTKEFKAISQLIK